MRYLCLSAAALLAVAGCKGADKASDTAAAVADTTAATTTAASPLAARARTAAAVANAMAANPAGADSILKANDFTRASFEQLMYDIAADSAASAEYAAAKSR